MKKTSFDPCFSYTNSNYDIFPKKKKEKNLNRPVTKLILWPTTPQDFLKAEHIIFSDDFSSLKRPNAFNVLR